MIIKMIFIKNPKCIFEFIPSAFYSLYLSYKVQYSFVLQCDITFVLLEIFQQENRA